MDLHHPCPCWLAGERQEIERKRDSRGVAKGIWGDSRGIAKGIWGPERSREIEMEGRVVFIFAPSIFSYYILIPKTYISSRYL
jgi:hypothetical protein